MQRTRASRSTTKLTTAAASRKVGAKRATAEAAASEGCAKAATATDQVSEGSGEGKAGQRGIW